MSRLSDAVLAITSCLGYWPMQETSGTTIDDAKSTNDLTLSGATLGSTNLVPTTTGGVSISFDGSNDYLRRDLPAAYKVDPITIMCVFRVPTSWPASTSALLALFPRGAFTGRGVFVSLTDTARLHARKGIGGSFQSHTGDLGLTANTTYMAFAELGTTGVKLWTEVVTADPADYTVAENRAGGNWNTNTTAIQWADSGAGNWPSPAQMYVGAVRSNQSESDDVVANAWFAKSLISDVALFSGTLDDTQRSALYEAATTVAPPGAFTSPVAGVYDIADAATIAWGVAPDPAATHELQYSRSGGAWTAIASGLTDPEYLTWIAPSPGVYQFRARAVSAIPSGWVYSSADIMYLRTYTGPTPRTLTQQFDADRAEDAWNLEELTGDFLTAVPGGYDAEPGIVPGPSDAGLQARGVDAICLGIETRQVQVTRFFRTRRPESPLFINNYAFEKWVKPLEGTGHGLSVCHAPHPSSEAVYGSGYEALFDVGGLYYPTYGGGLAYGAGLYVSTDKIAVRLYSDGWWQEFAPDTSYVGSEILTDDLNHIAVEVEIVDVGGVDTFKVRLFLNGVYCGDLSGTYVEFSQPVGALLGGGQAPLAMIGSWADYGNQNIILSSDVFGYAGRYILDSAAWYPYPTRGLTSGIWERHYLAGRATLDAVPAGAFDPLAAEYLAGSVLPLVWGAATGASGYLLRVEIDGVWSEVGVTTDPEYDYTLPETEHESVRFRVTPLFAGYAPEECAGADVYTSSFAVASSEPPVDTAALCTLRLDVYDDDRETILWSVATDPAHPFPYLDEPDNYGEQEIDVVAGAATIGQAEVVVIDRRQIPGDQDSGWLTEKLAQGIRGRRCRLRRYTLTGWVTIADGPAGVPRLDESYAAYRWEIRDTRETERKVRAFETSGTTTLWPDGILDGFAQIPAVEPVVGTIVEISATQRQLEFFLGITNVPAELVIKSAAEPILAPAVTLGTPDVLTWDQIRLLWRETDSGDPWTEVEAPWVYSGSMPTTQFLQVFDVTTEYSVAARAAISTTFFDITDGEPPWLAAWFDLPFDTEIDLIILPAAPATSAAFPQHVSGITAGAFLKNLYDGVYSRPDSNGDPIPTGIRYDPVALAQMTDEVTLRLTAPIVDARSWAEQHIYAPTGWVPALDNDGLISPVSQVPPVDFSATVEITNAITEPTSDWNAGERVVNSLVFEYPRYYIPHPALDIQADGDGLATQLVRIPFLDIDSILRHGEQEVTYNGLAFAAVGSSLPGPLGYPQDPDAIQNEPGWQHAQNRDLYVLDRFRLGAQAIDVPVKRSATAALRAGSWVRVALSWFPDYVTFRRGMEITGQVIAIRDLDCAWRQLLIEEVQPAVEVS